MHQNTQHTNTNPAPPPAGKFTRRIGNTYYQVSVHFSPTSKETINDKILRLIKNEVAHGKAAG